MVRKKEHYSKSEYSDWHRSLSDKCLAIDIDMVECRSPNGYAIPVAIMDTKHWDGSVPDVADHTIPDTSITGFQKRVYTYIADKLEVPYYVVHANINEENYPESTFFIKPMNDDAISKLGKNTYMKESEYRQWIEDL